MSTKYKFHDQYRLYPVSFADVNRIFILTEAVTGTSITDGVGNGIDNMVKNW